MRQGFLVEQYYTMVSSLSVLGDRNRSFGRRVRDVLYAGCEKARDVSSSYTLPMSNY